MSTPYFKLPELCRFIRYGIVVLVIATLAAHFWIWFSLGDVQFGMLTFFIHSGDLDAKTLSALPPLERILTTIISLPALIFLLLALFPLQKLMRYFENREYFVMPGILLLKGFCGAIFLYILCTMVEPVVRILVFNMISTVQEHALVLHLTDSFDELLLCGMFYVIARIMEEGRRLAEENSEFI